MVFLIQLQRLAPRVASIRPMKSKNDFTGRPSEAQDVLDPPATGRGFLGGQRLSGLFEALALFVIISIFSLFYAGYRHP